VIEISYDLALSGHGDLVVSGNRDLAGISGTDLIEQRIRLRLRVQRGSWIYDETQTLGSNLNNVIGMEPERAQSVADNLVREALIRMTEITVSGVTLIYGDKDVTTVVHYQITSEGEGSEGSEEAEVHDLTITLQSAGG
jgi:hypothetical protein